MLVFFYILNATILIFHEIESGYEKVWEILKLPSVQYCLFDKDSIIKSFQLGFSDIARQKSVNENTTYNAFSVTKTFTALAVLQLAECGKMDLEHIIQKVPGMITSTKSQCALKLYEEYRVLL